jgi:hypothetical protein
MSLEKRGSGSIKIKKKKMNTKIIFEIKIKREGVENSHFVRLTRDEEEFWNITFKTHNEYQREEKITLREVPIQTINDVLVLTNLYNV